MKKSRFIPLLGVVLLGATVVSVSKYNQLNKINGQGCDHVGYHYDEVLPSQSAPGHYEFWACCKCHEVFLSLPTVGSFVDNDESLMTGGLDENHPAYLPYIENYVTVKFIDTNESIIIKYVPYGGDLLDIPTPTSRTGYDVCWGTTDFTNLTEDIIVTPTCTAKTFVLDLDVNGGYLPYNTLIVTYDQPYILEAPTHDEYMFDTWKYGDTPIELKGIWNIDSSSDIIQLTAIWGESEWTDIF